MGRKPTTTAIAAPEQATSGMDADRRPPAAAMTAPEQAISGGMDAGRPLAATMAAPEEYDYEQHLREADPDGIGTLREIKPDGTVKIIARADPLSAEMQEEMDPELLAALNGDGCDDEEEETFLDGLIEAVVPTQPAALNGNLEKLELGR